MLNKERVLKMKENINTRTTIGLHYPDGEATWGLLYDGPKEKFDAVCRQMFHPYSGWSHRPGSDPQGYRLVEFWGANPLETILDVGNKIANILGTEMSVTRFVAGVPGVVS